MMTQTQPKPSSVFEQGLRAQLQDRLSQNQQPEWLEVIKTAAFNQFEILGLPNRRQEAWRFIDLSPLWDTRFESNNTTPDNAQNIAEKHPQLGSERLSLSFVNGGLIRQNYSSLPTGVILTDLATAMVEVPQLVQPRLGQILDGQQDVFALLNTALFSQGAFLYVPASISLSMPIDLQFITAAESNKTYQTCPKILVILEEGAKATINVHFYSGDSASFKSLTNSSLEFFVAQEAVLNCVQVHSENAQALHFNATRIMAESGSKVAMTTVSLGGQLTRHHVETISNGSNAQVSVNGLTVLNGSSQVHHHTLLDHRQPGCTSNQTYKGILDENSRMEFDGTIVIAKNAAKTDATQLNQNLLLSDNARVMTRPQLRIDNDDVKCAHGATVGQLEADQLFYLASRGISEQTAKSILTMGFAEEIIDELPDSGMRHLLTSKVLAALGGEQSEKALKEAFLTWST